MPKIEYGPVEDLSVYSIDPQGDSEYLHAFIDLPFTLRSTQDSWCPPFKQSVYAEISGQAAFSKELTQKLFLCYRQGKVVGRVAASVHPLLKERKSQSVVGQIGYFEAVNDQKVANVLLKAAADWLAQLSIKVIWGPINGAANTDYRFMIEGFDERPFLFEPRNPEYYPELFKKAGFNSLYEWFSVEGDNLSATQKDLGANFKDGASVTSEGFSYEFPDLADPQAAAKRLYAIFNRCWEGHLTFVPLSFDAFIQSVGKLFGMLETGDLSIAVGPDGDDIGFSFQYPNLWEAFTAMEGDANNLPSLAVSKRGSSYKAEKVMYAYGVVPQWRNKVIASTLFNKTLFNESNPLYSRDRFFIACVLKSLRQFKKYGKVNRRYALYQCETNVLQALVV